MQTHLIAGFDAPVAASQNVFRTLLQALSEPGLWHPLPLQAALTPLNTASWAILQTMLDSDTALYLAPSLVNEQVLANVRFHCGCEIVDDPAQADFLVVDAASAQTLDWRQLKRGLERSPEKSATLIVQLAGEFEAPAASTLWQGPGILGARSVTLNVDKTFWLQRAGAMAFPLGVDVVLTQDNAVLGLPRTTQVQFEGVTTCM